MTAAPTPAERAILRRVGVPEPVAENPLHVDMLDAIRRLRNAPEGTLNVALMWCWLSELDRQGRAHATAKSRYERVLGIEIIRLRTLGEKSATAAEKRAEAESDDVYQAHLDYRLAERLEIVARSALRILEVANDNWRTQQANARRADSFHADAPPQ